MNENDLRQLERENKRLKEILLQIVEFLCDEHASSRDLENWMTEMGILKKKVTTIYEVNTEWDEEWSKL